MGGKIHITAMPVGNNIMAMLDETVTGITSPIISGTLMTGERK
jgi:hypothetical protein